MPLQVSTQRDSTAPRIQLHNLCSPSTPPANLLVLQIITQCEKEALAYFVREFFKNYSPYSSFTLSLLPGHRTKWIIYIQHCCLKNTILFTCCLCHMLGGVAMTLRTAYAFLWQWCKHIWWKKCTYLGTFYLRGPVLIILFADKEKEKKKTLGYTYCFCQTIDDHPVMNSDWGLCETIILRTA